MEFRSWRHCYDYWRENGCGVFVSWFLATIALLRS